MRWVDDRAASSTRHRCATRKRGRARTCRDDLTRRSELPRIRKDFPPSSNGVEAPRLSCGHQSETEKGKSMSDITRAPISRVGVDLAKQVIQVHAVDASGRRVVARAIKRDQFFAWAAQLPAGC